MEKCSALLCGIFLILSPVVGQSTNSIQLNNYNILNTYCHASVRNTQSIIDVFEPICRNNPAIRCCSHVSTLIAQNPNVYLCPRNAGYILTRVCGPTIANSDEQIAVRTDDSKIVFIDDTDDEHTDAQQKSTTSSFVNAVNRPEQTSGFQNRVQEVATPSRPRPATGQAPVQSGSPQQGQTFQTFNFGNDPQYNVQVPIASTGPSQSNGQPANQPPRIPQRPSNSNSNRYEEDDDEDDDGRVPVETGTAGYQAMEFALDLFKNLERPPNSDSVISPLLPQLLLSNLYDFASPMAQAQLKKAIRLHPNQLAVIASKLKRISDSTVNTIETASVNFVADDVKLNRTYISDVRTRNVEVKGVNFGEPNVAARAANQWVSGKTHNLINEILNPSAINPSTRLLLANTIYFKGTWKYTFIESNPGTFESSPNNARQLNKMFQLNKLRYGEIKFPDGNGLRWVELPYEGNDLAMLVFLPTVRHQLEASIRQLKPYDLAKVMAELRKTYINTKVHLHMPKFTLTDSVSLIPALKRLGLHSIFQDPDALQYITNESTVVSDVTQRSFMSVDEFGTKATSVASLSIITLSITPQYRDVKFDVDQPFLTMIVDKQERYPFFIGQINDPRE